jgi:DNA-binding CsgD family transcriptional regulator
MTATELAAFAKRKSGRRTRPKHGWASLTAAECSVAQLAAEGLSNPEIAQRLFIARATVKVHLGKVYAKLGVSNRTELATEVRGQAEAGRPAGPPSEGCRHPKAGGATGDRESG